MGGGEGEGGGAKRCKSAVTVGTYIKFPWCHLNAKADNLYPAQVETGRPDYKVHRRMWP